MGKTPQPFKILLVNLPKDEQFQQLEEQGHTVHTEADEAGVGGYDIVFGPRCWRLLPELYPGVGLALKEARASIPRKARVPKVKK